MPLSYHTSFEVSSCILKFTFQFINSCFGLLWPVMLDFTIVTAVFFVSRIYICFQVCLLCFYNAFFWHEFSWFLYVFEHFWNHLFWSSLETALFSLVSHWKFSHLLCLLTLSSGTGFLMGFLSLHCQLTFNSGLACSFSAGSWMVEEISSSRWGFASSSALLRLPNLHPFQIVLF